MRNKERRRRHGSAGKVPVVVRRHIVRENKPGSKHTVAPLSVNIDAEKKEDN